MHSRVSRTRVDSVVCDAKKYHQVSAFIWVRVSMVRSANASVTAWMLAGRKRLVKAVGTYDRLVHWSIDRFRISVNSPKGGQFC